VYQNAFCVYEKRGKRLKQINKVGIFSFFSKEKKEKLDQGLEKTKVSLFDKISKALVGKSEVDDDFLDQLEEILVTSDVGIETTLKIIDRLQKRVSRDKYVGVGELHTLLKEEITHLLDENSAVSLATFENLQGHSPYVMMVVGVNGVGKTTTIGKLANQFKKVGKKVVLGAGDTFRAAAVAQLKIWGERNDVHVVEHGMNTDPAAVAFDAVKYAVDHKADVVIIDTAGRLHNKVNLMTELSKIKRVMSKVIPDAPHEILLVLDASTGQNAFEQARQFSTATEVNALALTKLDGTAKGGVVIGISDQMKVPVKYIGVGEGIDDLQLFDKKEFVNSLFETA
jgi:fused signal recognition particle receptor